MPTPPPGWTPVNVRAPIQPPTSADLSTLAQDPGQDPAQSFLASWNSVNNPGTKAPPPTVTSKISPPQTPWNPLAGILPYDKINQSLAPTDTSEGVEAKNPVLNYAPNAGKSLAKQTINLLSFFDPVKNANTIGQATVSGINYGKDIKAQQQSEQGVKDYIPRLQKQLAQLQSGNDPFTPEKQKEFPIEGRIADLQRLLKDAGAAPLPITPQQAVSNYQSALPSAAWQNIASPAVQTLAKGDFHGFAQSLSEDPFQLLPYGLMLKGATDPGGPLHNTAVGDAIDHAISKTSSMVTKPIGAAANAVTSGAANLATNLARYGTSQVTGMNPSTISTIINNPDEFSPTHMRAYTREGMGADVKTLIDDRLSNLQATGEEYNNIRQSGGNVYFDKSPLQTVLNKYGITLDKEGQIKTSAESVPLKGGDLNALQNFIDQYGKEDQLSANGFLNARKALSNLAEYDSSKSDISNRIAKDLRSVYDTTGKTQLPGLSETDAKYAPEIKLLNQIKKDYLNPDGSFKDNALTKITNAKGNVLDRLEKLSPGIGAKIKILNAVEDIQRASGQKVGAYARAAAVGYGAATFNPGAIVAAIMTSPTIATQILRGYGRFLGLSKSAIQAIKAPPNIENIKNTLNPDIENINPGLSIQDTSQNVNPGWSSAMLDRVNGLHEHQGTPLPDLTKPPEPWLQDWIKMIPESKWNPPKPVPVPLTGEIPMTGKPLDYFGKPEGFNVTGSNNFSATPDEMLSNAIKGTKQLGSGEPQTMITPSKSLMDMTPEEMDAFRAQKLQDGVNANSVQGQASKLSAVPRPFNEAQIETAAQRGDIAKVKDLISKMPDEEPLKQKFIDTYLKDAERNSSASEKILIKNAKPSERSAALSPFVDRVSGADLGNKVAYQRLNEFSQQVLNESSKGSGEGLSTTSKEPIYKRALDAAIEENRPDIAKIIIDNTPKEDPLYKDMLREYKQQVSWFNRVFNSK